MTLEREELERSPLSDLHAIASELGVEGYRKLRREELIETILGDGEAPAEAPPSPRGRRRQSAPAEQALPAPRDSEDVAAIPAAAPEEPPPPAPSAEELRTGILEILANGSGFMRADAFRHSREDVYVSPAQIRRLELRSGDELTGPVRPARRSERHPSLVRVDAVNGEPADAAPRPRRFEELTAAFASERLDAPEGLETAPFGKGSRVAVAGPPGSGTTTLLRRIALALAASADDLELVVVLAGVRPEEVTEWRRDGSVSVVGGGFEQSPDELAKVAELAVERAKRAAEAGRHAVVLIDSLDELPGPSARRVFAAARSLEEAGSLTVFATTGLAAAPFRFATTRIVLEAGTSGSHPPGLAPASGTLHADRLR